MSDNKEQELPFEEAMDQLEELVAAMEQGNLPLEDMIRQYETARKLAAQCQKKLSAMKKKIELLTKDDGKEGQWRDLTPGETQEEQQDFFDGKPGM